MTDELLTTISLQLGTIQSQNEQLIYNTTSIYYVSWGCLMALGFLYGAFMFRMLQYARACKRWAFIGFLVLAGNAAHAAYGDPLSPTPFCDTDGGGMIDWIEWGMGNNYQTAPDTNAPHTNASYDLDGDVLNIHLAHAPVFEGYNYLWVTLLYRDQSQVNVCDDAVFWQTSQPIIYSAGDMVNGVFTWSTSLISTEAQQFTIVVRAYKFYGDGTYISGSENRQILYGEESMACSCSPTPTPTPTPTPGTPTPTPTPEPGTPTPTPTPEPGTPTPTPTPPPATPTPTPSPEPTATPTPEPTIEPTPSPSPSPEPTASPSPEPTASPSPEPTAEPSPEPTAEPSPEPWNEYTVSGTVFTHSGFPFPGREVALNSFRVTTDEKGYYEFKVTISSGQVWLRVEDILYDYEPAEVIFPNGIDRDYFEMNFVAQQFVMTPTPTPSPSPEPSPSPTPEGGEGEVELLQEIIRQLQEIRADLEEQISELSQQTTLNVQQRDLLQYLNQQHSVTNDLLSSANSTLGKVYNWFSSNAEGDDPSPEMFESISAEIEIQAGALTAFRETLLPAEVYDFTLGGDGWNPIVAFAMPNGETVEFTIPLMNTCQSGIVNSFRPFFYLVLVVLHIMAVSRVFNRLMD